MRTMFVSSVFRKVEIIKVNAYLRGGELEFLERAFLI